MAKVAVNNLKNGMVTLSEVLDEQGHTLIRGNEELSEKHITLLKMWGVTEIDVKLSKQQADKDLLLSKYPANLVQHAFDLADERFKFFNKEDKITHLLKSHFINKVLAGANK